MEPLSLTEYILLAGSSLFVIVDPLAVIPAFLAMTPNDTPEQRMRMARLACCVVAGVLLGFAMAGELIFKVLGITMPAFQIAASIVLLLISLDMLRAQRSRVQHTNEEADAGLEKNDIAVTPLAIPMLAGPGAITSVMVLVGQVQKPWNWEMISILVSIAVTAVICYVVLGSAARVAKVLGETGIRILVRIMGLLLVALAVQYFVNGMVDLGVLSKPG